MIPQGKYLIFDLETTGLPNDYKAPASRVNNWPRIVDIAWILYDEKFNQITKYSSLIKPDGFNISASATNVHGISNQLANREGKPLVDVLQSFAEALDQTIYLVAHNMNFDQKVIESELIRGKIDYSFEHVIKVCTMKESTEYCDIEKQYGRGKKWPTLEELHRALFWKGLRDSHRALVDAETTANCFQKLISKGIISHCRASEAYSREVLALRKHHISEYQTLDWKQLASVDISQEPVLRSTHESDARAKYEGYDPGKFASVIGWAAIRRYFLKKAINSAIARDKSEYQSACAKYKHDCEMKNLSEGVLEGAVSSYSHAFDNLSIQSWCKNNKVDIAFNVIDSKNVGIKLVVDQQKTIPAESCQRLKNGGYSKKSLSKKKSNQFFKDFIGSVMIRISREVFDSFPMIKQVKFSVTSPDYRDSESVLVQYDAQRSFFKKTELENLISPFSFLESDDLRSNFKVTKGFVPFIP